MVPRVGEAMQEAWPACGRGRAGCDRPDRAAAGLLTPSRRLGRSPARSLRAWRSLRTSPNGCWGCSPRRGCAADSSASAYHALTRWDAKWYARIAEDGYGHVGIAPDGRRLSDYAFFPLFPALERVVAGVTGLAAVDAGLVISAVSSVVAAAGIYRVGARLHDARTGMVLVCLWSSVPVAGVTSMAYTEALFTALAAWCLVAVLADRLVVAGVARRPGRPHPAARSGRGGRRARRRAGQRGQDPATARVAGPPRR